MFGESVIVSERLFIYLLNVSWSIIFGLYNQELFNLQLFFFHRCMIDTILYSTYSCISYNLSPPVGGLNSRGFGPNFGGVVFKILYLRRYGPDLF